MSYEDLKKRLDESIRKEENRQRAIRHKKAEARAIKQGGGGHAIARAIMPDKGFAGDDTDFNYGANVPTPDDGENQNPSERCMGRVVCANCKKFHGYCADIAEDKEKLKMLPTGDGSTPRSNRKNGLNWVRIEDLSTTPQEAKIIMVNYNANGQYGPQVQLKLAFKGEMRYLGVKPTKNDPRYKTMLDQFGPDENNWVNQRIMLVAETDPFTEQLRMRVEIPGEPSRKSTTASSGSRR